MSRILVIDDNETMREGMAYALRKMGHTVDVASGGREGVGLFEAGQTDFVITDLKMDEVDGLAVIAEARRKDPSALCMVVTAFGTIETAVGAMKAGAYDFITKPFSMDLLRVKVEKALDERALRKRSERLSQEAEVLRAEAAEGYRPGEQVGESEPMKRVFKLLARVAPSDSTVHIYGESGTGKELVARAIHDASPRKDGPFMKVHCAALAESLLESELFGHEKGAFTNAVKRKLGRFELADGGTIFLDEIGDISPAVQVKLLRVIQEKEFERVGGESPVKVDVRIVSATNKDLKKEVGEGRFREDLYYRLHILPIDLPPLRDRKGDVALLVDHFVAKLRARTRHSVVGVGPDALDALQRYPWPGNVRELENVMEQTLVFAEEETIRAENLPPHVLGAAAAGTTDVGLGAELDGTRSLPEILEGLERRLIVQAFDKAGKVKTETARLLGIKTSALYYKLEKYGIQ